MTPDHIPFHKRFRSPEELRADRRRRRWIEALKFVAAVIGFIILSLIGGAFIVWLWAFFP